MNCKVSWTEQVEFYVRSKAPGPRRALLQGMKRLVGWDGRENPPKLRHLEDELIGYSRLRVGEHRVIFREAFVAGQREIRFIYAGPRSTVYEAFQSLFIDDLAS